jgi:hypothetical protein
MKKLLLGIICTFNISNARADLWGADLPLLAQIVFNTLNTMYQLQQQTKMLSDEMSGINDRISRIQTISDVVNPSDWNQWKDPKTALTKLQKIYQTLPKEYKSEKSDLVEAELSKAMNLISNVSLDTKQTFQSGKELEARALSSSPGVSQKLVASGMGTLITQQAQSQVIQSHVVSLLTQMLADGHEKETRLIMSKGGSLRDISGALSGKDKSFSSTVLGFGGGK